MDSTLGGVVDMGGRSLWVDEGLTVGLVSESFTGMINACVTHGQAVLFYICLWPWIRIWCMSEVSLAGFSAVPGITTSLIAEFKLTSKETRDVGRTIG